VFAGTVAITVSVTESMTSMTPLVDAGSSSAVVLRRAGLLRSTQTKTVHHRYG